MHHISSRQNAAVGRFKDAARGADRSLLLLDGVHLVADALAAGIRLREALIGGDAIERPDMAALADQMLEAGVELATASPPVIDAVSPVKTPSGIVALADRPCHTVASLFPPERPALVVIACDIQNPGNLGAIARVLEAAGGTGLIAAGNSADPFGWKALRGSMGSALRLPIAAAPSAEEAIRAARAHGCQIVATGPRNGSPPFEVDLTRPSAVLIGGEGPGLPVGIVADADELISIPMQPPVESLNAAVTAALIVYEARRQRG